MNDVKLDELWLMVIRRKHCPSVVKEQKRVRDSMQGYGIGEEEVDDRSIYGNIMGRTDANVARTPVYNARQMPQSKCATLNKINGAAIKAANTPAISTNTTLYLITYIHGSNQWYSWRTRRCAYDPTTLSLLLDRKERGVNLVGGPQPD